MPAPLCVPTTASLQARLSWCAGQFPPAEHRVADYLLRHGEKHADLTLAELADYAGVSKAVVVRMCQILGYSGFNGFRLQWAREHGSACLNFPDTIPELVNIVDALHNTAELLSPTAVEEASLAMTRAKQLLIYGSGGSGLVAQLAGATFASIGLLPITFNEAMWRTPESRLADAETVVFIISHRGANQHIDAVAKDDKEHGATIITLTSIPQSNLARIADILLITDRPINHKHKPLDFLAARTVQLAAIYTLAASMRRHIQQVKAAQTKEQSI